MIIPPAYDKAHRAAALRGAIVDEIARIVEDLEFRREFLREIWSVSRDRGAFLDTIATRWRRLTADDLLEFDSHVVNQIDSFYRCLEEFHLYLSFTQDMPTTLTARYDQALNRLKALGQTVVDILGGDPGRPLIEYNEGTVHGHVRSLFAAPKRPPPPPTGDEVDPSDWVTETKAAMANFKPD
jgi:hypothetical protein